MAPIAMVYNGVWSHYVMAHAPKYRQLYDLQYIHDLKPGDLDGYLAVVVPFQSHQKGLAARRDEIMAVAARGGRVFVEGDSSWIADAVWADRPVNNYWWVTDPDNPPAQQTDFGHPVYQGLKPRHACWHTHGCYVGIPDDAKIIQRNAMGEVVTFERTIDAGQMLVTTLDPIVEHGVQQIRHLDNYVDNLTAWLCGYRPDGAMTVDWRIGAAA